MSSPSPAASSTSSLEIYLDWELVTDSDRATDLDSVADSDIVPPVFETPIYDEMMKLRSPLLFDAPSVPASQKEQTTEEADTEINHHVSKIQPVDASRREQVGRAANYLDLTVNSPGWDVCGGD